MSGGVLKGATIGKGVTLIVDGQQGQGSAVDITVASGGTIVDSGGSIVGLTIKAGGTEIVAAGGSVNNVTVSGGVSITVSSGGTIGDSTIAGGTERVLSGGVVSGLVTFGAHGKLAIEGQPAGLQVSGFKTGNVLDLASFAHKAGEKLTFTENAAKTKGMLTITDGALTATITLFGQYAAAGFRLAGDGAGGTAITYATSAAALELTAPHG
jgi:autotransporter passenger strand-loop-strand repeat protein